jgi:hypothetical protein
MSDAEQPSEEELRAAYEEELSRVTVTDMVAQACVSLLNLAARRLEEDLEQARDGIDGARALLEILERRIPQEVKGLRDALSQLQMAYATKIKAPPSGSAPSGSAPSGSAPAGEGSEPRPGPAQSSGRLWVPGS